MLDRDSVVPRLFIFFCSFWQDRASDVNDFTITCLCSVEAYSDYFLSPFDLTSKFLMASLFSGVTRCFMLL